MKKLLPILLLFLLSCGDEPFFKEREASFFPVDVIGNVWDFTLSDGTKETWEVLSSEEHQGYEGALLQAGADTLIFYKNDNEIWLYSYASGFFDANEYVLQDGWQKYISYPLIVGRNWEDVFVDTISIYGVNVTYTSSIKASIIGKEDVTVKAGSFKGCYVLSFSLSKVSNTTLPGFENLNKQESYRLWLAPEVGIVKKQDSTGKVWLLSSYMVE